MEKELQVEAVNKVLAVKKEIEEELNKRNASWWETRENVDGKQDSKLECDFKKIELDVNTRKSATQFYFYNNGEIGYKKAPKTPSKTQNNICYTTTHNVLSNDYKVIIRKDCGDTYTYTTLSLENGILTKTFKDTTTRFNMETGTKNIVVDRLFGTKDDPTSYSLEIATNPDNSLESFTLLINIFDEGIHYEIKGQGNDMPMVISHSKVDESLVTDSTLWFKINSILYHIKENNHDFILSNFIDYITAMLSNNIELATETYDEHLRLVEYFETNVINDVKAIKNDVPVPGLAKRIDKSFKKSAKLEKKLNKKY